MINKMMIFVMMMVLLVSDPVFAQETAITGTPTIAPTNPTIAPTNPTIAPTNPTSSPTLKPTKPLSPDPLANYEPTVNLTSIARIDLDYAEYLNRIRANFDFNSAKAIYQNGQNVLPLTLKGLISGPSALQRLTKVSLFQEYSAFWKTSNYADDFINNALNGTSVFTGKSNALRASAAERGLLFHGIWMFVFVRLTESIEQCKNKNITSALQAWDEAWAYYTGSLEGPNGNGTGVFFYSLGEVNCVEYNTCQVSQGRSRSVVNNKILSYFEAGRALLRVQDCDTASLYIPMIQKKTLVPLIQGLIRATYFIDPKNSKNVNISQVDRDRYTGEAFVYATAVLPFVNKCNKFSSKILVDNVVITTKSGQKFVKDGTVTVVSAAQNTYNCLAITCAEVGGFLVGGKLVVPPCKQNELLETLQQNSAAAIFFLVIFILILLGFSLYCCYRLGFQTGFQIATSGPNPNANGQMNGTNQQVGIGEKTMDENLTVI